MPSHTKDPASPQKCPEELPGLILTIQSCVFAFMHHLQGNLDPELENALDSSAETEMISLLEELKLELESISSQVDVASSIGCYCLKLFGLIAELCNSLNDRMLICNNVLEYLEKEAPSGIHVLRLLQDVTEMNNQMESSESTESTQSDSEGYTMVRGTQSTEEVESKSGALSESFKWLDIDR